MTHLSKRRDCLLFFAFSFLFVEAVCAQDAGADSGFFQTPVEKKMLDESRFVEWFDGTEQPVQTPHGTAHVLHTRTSVPNYAGCKFGDVNRLGSRHLRIAFTEDVSVGTLLVQGIGIPRVLQAGLEKGDLADDTQWITPIRVHDRRLEPKEPRLARKDFCVWIFPPGTRTREIRFTHTPEITDKSYTGWLGGIYVLSQRLLNLAPSAQAVTASQSQYADRINNETNDDVWNTWSNGQDGAEMLVSPEHPEHVTLVWPRPVRLRGLCTLWTGFVAADAEVYVGPKDRHPRQSTDESDWKRLVSHIDLRDGYIPELCPNWFDFGREVTTLAVRLRITKALDATRVHPHVQDKIKDGKRIWLGEMMCFVPLGDQADPLTLLPPAPPKSETLPPPIPIRFTLPEAGLVTLVIEKEDGTRVRNLLAETPFPQGDNVAYWDGSDDLLRDNEAARHGLYNIPGRLVDPGKYKVRGLYRQPLSLRYEFSVYNEGTPPWPTGDNTGGWLTNHTPPYCALSVPGEQSPTGEPLVYLGSYVSEGGHGLAWFDVQSDKQRGVKATKKGGVGWVGGHWTGAQYLARDRGSERISEHGAYIASIWSVAYNHKRDSNKDLEVRITAIKPKGGQTAVKYTFAPYDDKNLRQDDLSKNHAWDAYFTGFSVHDGAAVLSMGKRNELVWIDTKNGDVVKTIAWPSPGGSTFDEQGNFYLLSNGRLYRFPKGVEPDAAKLSSPAGNPIVYNLDQPKAVQVDSTGNIYIAEQGTSHCIEVCDSNGKRIGRIGKKGVPKAGLYDELRMNHPAGMTIDHENRLWVAETDYQPKRVSVWTLDGKLIRAFYGPAEYGGGGQLDPMDPTRFYYNGMEFRLDWERGAFKLERVFFRPDESIRTPDGHHSEKFPETALYPAGKGGPRYFTNCFNCNPTNGNALSGIWYDDPETGVARLVAVLGSAHQWSIFSEKPFEAIWPEGIRLDCPENERWKNQCRVLWVDRNGDGRVQPDETRFETGECGGVTAGVSDGRLHFLASRISDSKERKPDVAYSAVLYPAEETHERVPLFDLSTKQILVSGTLPPRSSGGDQVLYDQAGARCVATIGVEPFARESVVGTRHGKPLWSYPNPWPGLHPSHEAATPHMPGQLIGVTRLLGDFIRSPYPAPLFAMNGNMGNIYLMTSDGLFVAELFHDVRTAPTWSMPIAQRNMDVGGLTLHDENFWPSITQTSEGKVFLVDGANTALVRVDGLDTIRELESFSLELGKDELLKAGRRLVEAERNRQRQAGQQVLRVPLRKDEIVVDGKLADWEGTDWATIDRSGVKANFNSDSKPYDVTAAVAVSRNRLVAAFRTNLKDLLRNSGEMEQALFKTGGCLDLMIGVNPKADPNRREPVEGDLRLLVTLVDRKPRAILYRAVVPGTKDPVPFSSPWRTISFDRVEDVTEKVEFASDDGAANVGVFEIAIPLEVLGLKPQPGVTIKGDIGILRGNGFSTLARVYWSNKATAITADVPSEAQLTPNLWGNWLFE